MIQSHSPQEDLEIKKTAIIRSRVSPWLTRFLYPLGNYIVMPLYFGRIEVTGQENIPRTDPVIVAPTHRSRWDALIVPYATGRLVSGRDLRFMVSANEVKGLQGWFIERMGGFPVDTDRPGIGSLRHSVELLCEGEMIVIFPEGGIFRDTRVHPLKRGVARIALEVESNQPGSGVKILPISLKYSQPYPSWGCDVKIKIGSPLNVADYSSASVKKSSEQLTADLEAALKDLHEKKVDSVPMAAA
ncbi:MAG: lysophospholipid acyltransferase family protein [Xenococcaceae cyanobacterium]